MNRLVWKLLRQHISKTQLGGFFIASLFGMTIVLLGIQFYQDVKPAFTESNTFLKKEYIIATRKISTLGNLTGKTSTFSSQDITDLRHQPFTKSIGIFTPSMFNVSAGLGMKQTGIHLSTEMFFEAVPDKYVDIPLTSWHFNPQDKIIPIVIPRNYLNLYNFGFAQSRNLPKLSEGLMNLIQIDIRLSGNGISEMFKGKIVGFSNRLNTILVPQEFMDWANARYAPEKKAKPSRLIIEVSNPADSSISHYFTEKGYESEGDTLDSGKATYFLRIVTSIVISIGLIITILAFYILTLSIFLLIQKDNEKLHNLQLIGYSPSQVGTPYYLLTISLNLLVCILATGCVMLLRHTYLNILSEILPLITDNSFCSVLLAGFILAIIISALNICIIRNQLRIL